MIYANPEHLEKLSKPLAQALAQTEVHWGPDGNGEMLTLTKLREVAKAAQDSAQKSSG